jgi:hypothetical protein
MKQKLIELNLYRYGLVKGEILWTTGKLFKITFKPGLFKKKITEIFHHSEILNFNEIYVNTDIDIKVV